jgi:uncharacterized membrane protein
MHSPEAGSPVEPAAAVPRGVEATRWVAVACVLGLIVLSLAWELWLPARPSLWVVKVLPLCVPVVGLLKRRMYTYRWVSLLVWLYFTEGVVRAYSDRGLSGQLAFIEIVLCLALFAACVLHVRTRQRKAKP